MRYRRNNLFLPLVILSATRHIHDPITRFIGRARNATNDILNAPPIGISTSVPDATRNLGSFSAATTIAFFDFEPTQVAVESGHTFRFEDDRQTTLETPGIPPRQGVTLVQPTGGETEMSICTPEYAGAKSLEFKPETLHGLLQLGDNVKEAEVLVEEETPSFVRPITHEKDGLVVSATLHVVKYLRSLAESLCDFETLIEIVSSVYQGESVTRPADPVVLSHICTMANFLYIIFCVGWSVPWEGRREKSATKSQHITTLPSEALIHTRIGTYIWNKQENGRDRRARLLEKLASDYLPSALFNLLVDNNEQPIMRSLLRTLLRSVYSVTLFVWRLPQNAVVILTTSLYFVYSVSYICMRSVAMDTAESVCSQFYTARRAIELVHSLVGIKDTSIYQTQFLTYLRSASARVMALFAPITSGTRPSAIHVSPDVITYEEGLSMVPSSCSADSLATVNSDTSMFDLLPATCKVCAVLEKAKGYIRSCEALSTSQSERRLSQIFINDLLNYYRSVLNTFSNHKCTSGTNGDLMQNADVTVYEDEELLHHMKGITEADERMSQLVQSFASPSSGKVGEGGSMLFSVKIPEFSNDLDFSSTSTSSEQHS